ncbi:MAG: folate family ECF transporter S component [Bacilli bacterium]|nr:folate family ECF transporter S component [Bacilli bacterium]
MTKSKKIIRQVVFGAIFASVAIIMKLFISYETQFFAVRIFEIPIMIAGILLGPLYGGLVGLVTDLVYSMINIRGLNVGPNLFTVEAMLFGIIPGIVFTFFRYKKTTIILSTVITLIIAFIVSSTQLFIWQYEQPASFFALLPYRFLVMIIKIPFEIIILHYLITYKGFSSIKIYQDFYQKHHINIKA